MKINFLYPVTVLLVAVLYMSATGCKEDTIIKAGITPASDFLYTDNKIGDTLTINTKTIFDDSINTSFNISGVPVIHGLGTINDPVLGRSSWGIYTQVVPVSANLILPSPVDSAVLILPYAGFTYGDTSLTQSETFTVYRVSEDLSDTATYYSKMFTPYESVPIGTATVVLSSLKDSVHVAGANRAPHLRIKLTNTFRDLLVEAAKNSTDNPAFQNIIKGLYIGSDTNNTSIRQVPYFTINGIGDYMAASIAMYYSDNGKTDPDSVRTSFLNFVTGSCAHYNYITRKYNPAITALFQSTAVSDSIMILQNEPGASFDIHIPNLKNLPIGLINKAQLVITKITQPGDESDKFFEPLRIYPVGVHTDGSLYSILDRQPITSSAPLILIDGNRTTTTLPSGVTVTQYYLNIPREVQKTIVDRADELHLRINGTVTYPGAYRLIAGGKSSNSTYKIRLNIVYTKIN